MNALFWWSIAFGALFLAVTFGALRKKRFDEPYAVVWVLVGIAMLAVSFSVPFHLLGGFAKILGIVYPPAVLLLVATLVLFVLEFFATMAISRLTVKITRVTQELALLQAKVERMDGGKRDRIPSHF